ncbi:Trihydrophobin [Mycena sanguinolenta]|uniref:Trihydrophobin n=1 Tax=Mycena sanguinolenta TaxID=230812 RepID=A0A8H6XYI6_9AGAR|nr:Trihydrophobin [Mycena sanguinolenta]
MSISAMQLFPVVLLVAYTTALAAASDYQPCSSTAYGSPQCCDADVVGLADLGCQAPPDTPTDATDFTDICAASGQTPRCCAAPIADIGVLCQTPAGVAT